MLLAEDEHVGDKIHEALSLLTTCRMSSSLKGESICLHLYMSDVMIVETWV